MVKKASRRLVYALSSASSDVGGHSLGVNSLAIDNTPATDSQGTLYSAGRDGIINAWNLKDMNLLSEQINDEKNVGSTTSGARIQIHTNWVNDIILTNNNQSVVSCSSDLTVKLWSPAKNEQSSIGQHLDYVKCLASPSQTAGWVVSGGLDRRINGWDLAQGGQRFSIDVGEKGKNPKGSIYALAVSKSETPIIASGGPESIVRLWDSRTTEPICKFVGHTDNIRSILISDDGDWVLSASSDSTIKLWSTTSSRLLRTFDMHDDSVWSLFSDHSSLDVFYSSDRSGMVVKTDLRGSDKDDIDSGLCCALCSEHEGVSKVVVAGAYLWTATSNSRIHRWRNADMAQLKQKPANKQEKVIKTGFLRLQGGPSLEFVPEPALGHVEMEVEPAFMNPVETLKGNVGLIKHRLLSDKRRVLTLDTAGDIKMWDLVRGVTLQSFDRGQGLDIDMLADQLNSFDFVANWCQVSIRTGELYVVLEESSCFDAEVYGDELTEENLDIGPVDDEHRINYGRWVIRNVLTNLLNEILVREAAIAPSSSSPALSANGGNKTNGGAVDYNSVQKVEEPVEPALKEAAPNPTDAKSAGGGKFMGKLRGFGKSKKDKNVPVEPVAQPPPPPPPVEKEYNNIADLLKVLRTKSTPLYPPPTEDAPLVDFPAHVKIMISEQLPDSGGAVDLYRGTIGSTGKDVELLEQVVPGWIGKLLLQNEMRNKEPPKVGFVVHPSDDGSVPTLNSPNVRLTAYHMLRARKVLLYVVERLKADGAIPEVLEAHQNDNPEDWLELFCQGHKIPPSMTVATIRTRLWRNPGDVVLKYRVIS
jgi:WD40 repeat protein